ncbi:hypothetical protein KKF38_04505 [Patescibacteria group bacterium]|nr:hypothetical protein [Patescibacteria group bacterium]
MKKIIAAFTLTMLLSGCNFGSGPAETIPDEMEEIQPAETALDDNLFIALSAEILCLPSSRSEATAEEIEIFAKNILKNADVSEEAFSIYQQTIEADAASKKEISLAILGKMGEFCTIVEGGEEEIAEEDLIEVEDSEEVTETSKEEAKIVENNEEKICVVSGCNGEVCAEESFDSACVAKKEYQCYNSAICEVQEDGECGWTQSLELVNCLAEMEN